MPTFKHGSLLCREFKVATPRPRQPRRTLPRPQRRNRAQQPSARKSTRRPRWAPSDSRVRRWTNGPRRTTTNSTSLARRLLLRVRQTTPRRPQSRASSWRPRARPLLWRTMHRSQMHPCREMVSDRPTRRTTTISGSSSRIQSMPLYLPLQQPRLLLLLLLLLPHSKSRWKLQLQLQLQLQLLHPLQLQLHSKSRWKLHPNHRNPRTTKIGILLMRWPSNPRPPTRTRPPKKSSSTNGHCQAAAPLQWLQLLRASKSKNSHRSR